MRMYFFNSALVNINNLRLQQLATILITACPKGDIICLYCNNHPIIWIVPIKLYLLFADPFYSSLSHC